ncbi:MAG: N-acetylmuramic acid 6-phosphate etherase [Fimbriimonas ginsengisoli]|uniref:N-acetylmuramic acid 6-phosphate etherase n=1 Tax=Fimbriimonas ginsengisoli TaxID=1005039 RepID=A0A931LZZ1_FIMGI|nr:N-acetylmuramic acid 6-phosphate etherase [Fimbriimonas ginsengisoli]
MGTESRNPRSYGLDRMSAREIVRLMDEEEVAVMRAMKLAEPEIALVAEKVSQAYLAGGRIVYVGAGTSGRIALMDAAEMPPTFGIDSERFIGVVSGGDTAASRSIEDAEDDEYAAIITLNNLKLERRDVLIALAASGRTPYVVAAVRHARQKGVWTCGIANNRGTPLLETADLGILLDTGPEVLTGSTRLKAATAQKLALNRISTAAMVLSGKVVENLMVDVKAKNQKLKERCARIVTELSTKTFDEAWDLLEAHDWNLRRVLQMVRSPVGAPSRS